MNPFEFVNSINTTKIHMMEEDPRMESEYDPFMVNRALSYFPDTIMYANDANMINNVVDKRLQYDYLFHSVRKARRFTQWGKKKKIENLDLIKEFFLYSNQKAIEALSILTDEQIEMIRETRKIGGLK